VKHFKPMFRSTATRIDQKGFPSRRSRRTSKLVAHGHYASILQSTMRVTGDYTPSNPGPPERALTLHHDAGVIIERCTARASTVRLDSLNRSPAFDVPVCLMSAWSSKTVHHTSRHTKPVVAYSSTTSCRLSSNVRNELAVRHYIDSPATIVPSNSYAVVSSLTVVLALHSFTV
jgi:hypothetical protein